MPQLSRLSRRPARRAALVAAAVLALTAAALPADRPAGLGDRLFPDLGNPGYNVLDYDIALTYHGNDRPLDAVTTIDALATEALPALDLDFARGAVRSVRVNGRTAAFRTVREELVVTPAAPVPAGGRLRITVAHTSDPLGSTEGGWIRTPDGLAMANQADAAHRVFPCNDHPSDKARFTFRVTAPKDLTVVAGGLRLSARATADRTGIVWTYRTSHPAATELAQVSIGRSVVIQRSGPHELPLRDVIPAAADRALLEKRLAMTPSQIAWMERQVGPYPFETYGILGVDTGTGFELETQTLSLFENRVLLGPEEAAAPVMVHELAHQWFGNSVTPDQWSDVWLNEGHATWYQWLYSAEEYGHRTGVTVDELARSAYEGDNALRAAGGPPAAPLPGEPGKLGIFRGNIYISGALALYALRQEIGADAFQRLERAWVAAHRDGNASTADFVALASRTAGRDLAGFLSPWLYGTGTPPMPGHPDWRPGPGGDAATPQAGGATGRTLKPA